MNINNEINSIFEAAAEQVEPKTQILADNMLFDMQKLVMKNAEVIIAMGEIIRDLSDRVSLLEEPTEELFDDTLKLLGEI